MITCCESCLPKQEMFTLEDIEHIIEYVLDIDLPEALRRVRATDTAHKDMRNGMMNGITIPKSEPCWDCKTMMPVLLRINEVRD
jgi:hypothetical protein